MDSPRFPEETVLITGGGGYFGFRLGCALNQKGARVILFDITQPAQNLPEGIKFVCGDIRCLADVETAFQDAEKVACVFHVASYGMSGREQLNKTQIEEVNVGGTENILRACLPLHLHPDHYSRTKSIAEKKVLEANGLAFKQGDGILRTCAIRPAGIYGAGEQRHLPRIVSYIERGLFRFVYGDPQSLVEFVHVDNLAKAHILASEALKADKGHVASGQPYFISDGRPVNNFEFFRPLVEGLGYTFPSTRLPLTLIYCLAFLVEMTHFIVGRLYNFQPFLTRTEVYKTGVTHYFSLEKAKKELGFEPQPFDLQEVVEWFKAHGHGRGAAGQDSEFMLWDGILILLLALSVLTWILPSTTLSI